MIRIVRQGARQRRRAGLGLRLGLLIVASHACALPPARGLDDKGPWAIDPAATPLVAEVLWTRTFGPMGERLLDVVDAGDAIVVLSDRASYVLDDDGTQQAHAPYPLPSSGTLPALGSAAWDGTGLGVIVHWGEDDAIPAGVYLALTDARGAFFGRDLVAIGSPAARAQSVWNGAWHQVVVAEPRDGGVHLQQRAVGRSNDGPSRDLAQLPQGTVLGELVRGPDGMLALCTVGPHEGRVAAVLRLFGDNAPTRIVDQTPLNEGATGRCLVGASNESYLAVFGLVPRVAAADAGPATVHLPRPVAVAIDAAGHTLAGAHELTRFDGTIDAQQVLWDGERFVVLFNPRDYRGGRLVLSTFAIEGAPQARDVVVPLAYEPGRLLGGRLTRANSAWVLAFAIRRPWDEGQLYFARLALTRSAD